MELKIDLSNTWLDLDSRVGRIKMKEILRNADTLQELNLRVNVIEAVWTAAIYTHVHALWAAIYMRYIICSCACALGSNVCGILCSLHGHRAAFVSVLMNSKFCVCLCAVVDIVVCATVQLPESIGELKHLQALVPPLPCLSGSGSGSYLPSHSRSVALLLLLSGFDAVAVRVLSCCCCAGVEL